MVRGEPERIVHVDDARAGGAQALDIHSAHAWIDGARIEARELEDLRRAVDAGALRRYVTDPARGLELGAPLAQLLAFGMQVEDLPRHEVEPVLP